MAESVLMRQKINLCTVTILINKVQKTIPRVVIRGNSQQELRDNLDSIRLFRIKSTNPKSIPKYKLVKIEVDKVVGETNYKE